MVHEKNLRVSVFRNSIIHKIFLRILAAIPVCRNLTSLPALNRDLRFHWVLDFWLAWSTGLPVLAFQQVYLTQLRDRNLSHTGLPVLV